MNQITLADIEYSNHKKKTKVLRLECRKLDSQCFIIQFYDY